MIDRIAINNILSIASEIERIGEIVAGSNREKQVIEVVRKYIEDYVDEFWIENVPVTTWHEDTCVVEGRGGITPCTIHPPYQGVIDEEINRSNIVSIDLEELSEKGLVIDNIHDKIVLVDAPADPDDIATVAHILAQYRPRLIIVRDNGESLRRIVVLDNIIALYRRAGQPFTPVVHIRRSIGSIDKLVNSRLYAKSEAYKSYGYNIVAVLNKRYDNRCIYITAHHDHWLSGGSDNIIGTSIVAALSKILRDVSIDNTIVLASFTAEEGFPEEIASFYWLVGSRYHINKRADKIVDHVALTINIDTIYRDPLTASASSIIIRNIIRSQFKDVVLEHDSIIFDSFSFTSIGVPSVTFNTFRRVVDEGLYHSDKDYVGSISLDVILKTVKSVYMLVNRYAVIDRDAKYINVCDIDEELHEILGRAAPIELLLNLYRLCEVFHELKRYVEKRSCMNFVNLFNRIVNIPQVSREIGRRLGVREDINFIRCDEHSILIPTDIGFKDYHECYRNINFNLELLAYILLKQCY
ncbi:MAG: M28 family peptidase [Ignisphaera sp.]|nr:M28 family peptidase [Ignisphaera sp.]MCX8167510.1 M28 family peptidase [Ignisphaera sp.]MDW8084627.1 M28 family peptidase [Ignisphaera sp.]